LFFQVGDSHENSVQGNGMDELPERLIGAVRVSHLSLASAISPPPEAD